MLDLRSDSGVILADAERILRHSHRRVTRVSVLDDLWNPLPGLVFTGETGYAIGGTISQSLASDVRRTLTLQVANPDGVWTPRGEGSAFYWDKHVLVERGVRFGGAEFYAPQGTFLIDSPETSRNLLTLTGSDRMDRATRSEFTTPISYATGSSVGATIRDILEDAGVGATRWSVDDGGSTLGATRSYEVGEARLSAARALATDFALEVFADAEGWMRVRPKPDPNTLASAWTFREGVDATHLGISKRWSRDRFYNHILVSGEQADTSIPIVRAEMKDENPASPTRWNGPMGDRLYKHVSAMITTQQQADAVAASLLYEHVLIEEEIQLAHIPNPTLEVSDAITIVDPPTDTDDKFAVSTLTIPLGLGAATLGVKKVRRVS